MSDTKKNRITVEIYGQQYVILGTESANHIRAVAILVDEKMREIKSRNPSLDTSKLAVLTAVNAVNEYIKITEELEMMEDKLQIAEKKLQYNEEKLAITQNKLKMTQEELKTTEQKLYIAEKQSQTDQRDTTHRAVKDEIQI